MKKTKCWRRLFSFVLAVALVVSSGAFTRIRSVASAKTKTPKLSAKSVKVKVGSSKKVTVKNKPSGAKVTWTSKNKKIAKVKSGKITGVKKGSTKVVAKVTYKKNKKKVTKKLTVKVTVTAKSTETPATDPDAKIKGLIAQSNVGAEHKSASGLTTKDNGLMRKELTSLNLIDYGMGIGWNMGNTMEQSNFKGTMTTVAQCETSAGNPEAVQKTFDGLKQRFGVNTVRIPVAWSNFMSTDGKYTINKELLDRVETLVNYALNNEMYVIINEHWDGGWWGMFGSPDENVRAEGWKKYEAIWTQVAERFKDYSDHLIFEAQNEELSSAFPTTENWGLNTKVGESGFLDGTAPAGTLTEDEIYETAYKISQKFVDIVRQSGGNNEYRHLLIPGNTTDIDKACDERFKMPTDIEKNGKDKLSVSVHIYKPDGFALSASSSEEGYRSSWGTDEDKKYLKDLMSKVSKFTAQGYGVIAGECGVVKPDKNNIIDWMNYYFDLCEELHINPCLWDEGHYYNRTGGFFNYQDYGDCIAARAGLKPEYTAEETKNMLNTGVCEVPTEENRTPKVVYTWTGEFMRHTNKDTALKLLADRGNDGHFVYMEKYGEGGVGYTESITDGMKEVFDPEFWNITVTCDWSKIEKPCIRIYPADNVVSQGADLQLAYEKNKKNDPTMPNGTTHQAADYTGNWVGEYIQLNKEKVTGDYPWIWVTTNTYTGASYVKIEICDAAYNADGTAYQK